jgi:ubiquinone/menaquinone biosynthesis C-methylase UbiE
MTAASEPLDVAETRAAYDTVAVDYERLLRGALAESPWDRAVLGAFAELVPAGDEHPVADVGCGPGRITVHLDALGLDVRGLDLSSQMVDVARRTHPDLRFDVASVDDLGLADASLAGLVAWYSVIHSPPSRLPSVFAEMHRVLRRDGVLLLAFQVGSGQAVRHDQAYGHAVTYDSYRHSPDTVADLLQEAGMPVQVRTIRQPEGHERTAQAYVVARKGG